VTHPTQSIPPATLDGILSRLAGANQRHAALYPGESLARQPLHTVYGGAQLFVADMAPRLGRSALQALETYAPDPWTLARALELPGWERLPEGPAEQTALLAALDRDGAALKAAMPHAWLAWAVHRRVAEKLRREPVEDFRIDFEDGFGVRPDAEEDAQAVRCGEEAARAHEQGVLPAFFGIRIKNLGEEMKRRALRTMDLFVTAMLRAAGGRLPRGFVVTLPKVPVEAQVSALADALDAVESALGLGAGAIPVELMIELPQTVLDSEGRGQVLRLVRAARGRCTGAHFGTYDYTASCNITAQHQAMDHLACDFAKHLMQVSLAQTGVFLSDGATNVMPVGPHRAADGGELSFEQQAENRRVVHRAWRLGYQHIRRSLSGGFYQGWDLHPNQLVVRYAAAFAFFLEGLDAASARLRNFVEKAAQATLVGDVFDDAATGQALLNYFLRALNSGAASAEEVAATGLSMEELEGRSFLRILENRKRL
jgi:citrate lyase beta subunit